jgi:membrane protein
MSIPLTRGISPRQAFALAKQTYGQWSEHQAPRLGASVAFYSVLSFAPLLVLITGIIALVFGQRSAQHALIDTAAQYMGARGADTVTSLLKSAQKPTTGIFASVVAFATLMFGASGVFTELQDALNVIWDVPKKADAGFMTMIKQRLFSFGMILSIGFLLLVSLILSAGLAFVGKLFANVIPLPEWVLQALNFALSFAVITVLFALMFKYVPDAKVSWRDVTIGAVGTALLFTVGKFALGLYLGKASVGSMYGAAGSLVAVIVWIYYSAQIFFFGAEFTHVHASARGAAENDDKPVREAVPRTTDEPQTETPVPAPSAAREPAPAREPVEVSGTLRNTQRPPFEARPRSFAYSHQTKPRLLMAAALGFLLGQVFAGFRNEKVK